MCVCACVFFSLAGRRPSCSLHLILSPGKLRYFYCTYNCYTCIAHRSRQIFSVIFFLSLHSNAIFSHFFRLFLHISVCVCVSAPDFYICPVDFKMCRFMCANIQFGIIITMMENKAAITKMSTNNYYSTPAAMAMAIMERRWWWQQQQQYQNWPEKKKSPTKKNRNEIKTGRRKKSYRIIL